MKYHEIMVEGIRVYIPELVELHAKLMASGRVLSTNLCDIQEYLEKKIPKAIEEIAEILKKEGFKYVVVMTIAQYHFSRKKRPAIPLDSVFLLVLYKKKPNLEVF